MLEFSISPSGSCMPATQWRSEGGRGRASAPGRRPEGGAKILPKNFSKFKYREIFINLKEYNENVVIIL